MEKINKFLSTWRQVVNEISVLEKALSCFLGFFLTGLSLWHSVFKDLTFVPMQVYKTQEFLSDISNFKIMLLYGLAFIFVLSLIILASFLVYSVLTFLKTCYRIYCLKK